MMEASVEVTFCPVALVCVLIQSHLLQHLKSLKAVCTALISSSYPSKFLKARSDFHHEAIFKNVLRLTGHIPVVQKPLAAFDIYTAFPYTYEMVNAYMHSNM
jgi:hypothetical protein